MTKSKVSVNHLLSLPNKHHAVPHCKNISKGYLDKSHVWHEFLNLLPHSSLSDSLASKDWCVPKNNTFNSVEQIGCSTLNQQNDWTSLFPISDWSIKKVIQNIVDISDLTLDANVKKKKSNYIYKIGYMKTILESNIIAYKSLCWN